jgi:hypothetical protein
LKTATHTISDDKAASVNVIQGEPEIDSFEPLIIPHGTKNQN